MIIYTYQKLIDTKWLSPLIDRLILSKSWLWLPKVSLHFPRVCLHWIKVVLHLLKLGLHSPKVGLLRVGYSKLCSPHTQGWLASKKGGLNILLLVPYIPRARYCSPGSPNNQVWIIQSWLLIHPGLNIPVMVPFTSRARYSHPGSLYTHGRILQYLAPYTPRVRYSSLGSTYN